MFSQYKQSAAMTCSTWRCLFNVMHFCWREGRESVRMLVFFGSRRRSDWLSDASPCGRGSTERTNGMLLHKMGFSPKTLAGVKPMSRLLNMLRRNNCNQWQKRNPSVPWWAILGSVTWLISELGSFCGDPEKESKPRQWRAPEEPLEVTSA